MRATLLLSLPLVALAAPALVTRIENTLEKRAGEYWFGVEEKCREEYGAHPEIKRYDKMLTAVNKAKLMVREALDQWWDEGKHGEIVATYLGVPDDGKWKDNEFVQKFHANLEAFSHVAEGESFIGQQVHVGCEDVDNKCGTAVEGTNKPVAGYALNWCNILGVCSYRVVLCETWYLTDTPDGFFNSWQNRPQEEIALNWMDSDAGKMLHEFMHIDYITESRGHIIDVKDENGLRRYTAPGIANWVKKGGKTEDLINNADTYTQFIQAIYYKNKFGFTVPPERPEIIEEVNTCGKGEDNNYVESSQDRWIDDFCKEVENKYEPGSEGTISKEYDDGTPDAVRFSFNRRKNNLVSKVDMAQDCREALPKVFHNCDTQSHLKHGGSYDYNLKLADGGLEFRYGFGFSGNEDRPWPVKSPLPSSCDVYNSVGFADVWVYGGGWESHNHGQDKLLPNLRKQCGYASVSGWTFNYFDAPDQGGNEWLSRFSLAWNANNWNCVRQAVVDSGGNPNIGCGGH